MYVFAEYATIIQDRPIDIQKYIYKLQNFIYNCSTLEYKKREQRETIRCDENLHIFFPILLMNRTRFAFRQVSSVIG